MLHFFIDHERCINNNGNGGFIQIRNYNVVHMFFLFQGKLLYIHNLNSKFCIGGHAGIDEHEILQVLHYYRY